MTAARPWEQTPGFCQLDWQQQYQLEHDYLNSGVDDDASKAQVRIGVWLRKREAARRAERLSRARPVEEEVAVRAEAPVVDWDDRAYAVDFGRAVKAIVKFEGDGYAVLCWYPGPPATPLLALYAAAWSPDPASPATLSARGLYVAVSAEGRVTEQAWPDGPAWLEVFRNVRAATAEEWAVTGVVGTRRDSAYKPPAVRKPKKPKKESV